MANSNMYKLGTKSQYMNTYSKNITKMVNELKDIGRQGGEIYNVKYKNISKV